MNYFFGFSGIGIIILCVAIARYIWLAASFKYKNEQNKPTINCGNKTRPHLSTNIA